MGRVSYPSVEVLAPANYVTALDGFTLRPNLSYVRKSGGVVTVYLNFITENALEPGTNYDAFTLDATITPRKNVLFNVGVGMNEGVCFGSTGNVKLNVRNSVAAGSSIYVGATYLV